MKSILITSNAYYPNIGGIENSLRYLAQAYVKQGYRVDVVISDVNNVTDEKLAEFEELDGLNIHRYATTHELPIVLRPFSGVWSLKALYALLKRIKQQHNPALTISRFHTTTWLAKLAKLDYVVYLLPGVVKFQNHPERLSSQRGLNKLKQHLRYRYHVWLQQNALKRADKLAVFSHNMREQVESCYLHPSPLLLTKPGVDSTRFCPIAKSTKRELREQLAIPQNCKVLLGIGRFVKAKGFMYVLQAIIDINNVHLILVGGGEEEQLYRDFVIDNNLEQKVTFTGVIQDPTRYYQISDLFVMSSTYEPLGQTILEALSCGLPIVAFQPSVDVITATFELLNETEAVFVEQVNANLLAKAISDLFGDSEKMQALSDVSRTIAVERFSWHKLAQRLADCE
ncbi:MAG: glycosyltransferase involved in cell wall biosynthesis [Colwellia polaris]|jgi:glycosyltransferase involved in cell wall biosynthesis|tara:strand:+ start:3688 stop:4881 length:1194 start_codon:yes stop_codon:yes gene_type:complete